MFVCRPALPDPACQSVPLLTAAASLTAGESEPIRLVPISQEAEIAVAGALDLPRAAMLGLHESAPGARSLVQFVREAYKPPEVPWLRPGPIPGYLPLKVETTHVTVGSKTRIAKRKTPPS